ncbi:MAG: hypothetical protein JWQ76_2354 [Ramlibacter sp.]|nr:hypothetical protein [Ramlibacter sp.]
MTSKWSTRRVPLLIAAAALLSLLAALWFTHGSKSGPVVILDPARIILLRTAGGFLEVGAMEKVEEFGWSSRYTCPLVDCPDLLTPTISRIRVRAHYVYRLPLADEWKLELAGDHYKLTVPQPQLQAPVGFHTNDFEIQTVTSGWFSPPAAANREAVIRHLGPELAQRGSQLPYLEAQRPNAEKTVQEFARKWMIEQGKKASLPIRVAFSAPSPL